MKILVTGSAGYIGSEVMFRLELMGLNPIGFDQEDTILPKSDITIHLASDIYGIEEEDFYDEISLTFEVIKKTKGKIVFTSSAGVYGNSNKPNKENQKLIPINEYGKAKALIESIIQEEFDGKYSILRLANVYSKNATHGLVSNILKGGNTLYNKGTGIRDFVHLHNVVNVIIEAALTDKWNGVYNIGTGKGTRVKDIYKWLSDKKPKFEEKEEIKESVLDISKARKNGFKPSHYD